MNDVKKMMISDNNGNEIEVDIVTTFFNKDETKEYIMYTKNEEQDGNSIVYISRLTRENDKNYLDEIADDEWLDVKNKIRELIA